MLIQGNLVGFGMFIISAVFVAIGSLILKLPNPVVMITAGSVLILIDLILRFLKRNNPGWLMGKGFGGYLYFAPVWVFGVIVIIINIINVFVGKS